MNLETLAVSRRHSHVFSQGNPMAEKNTRRAMILTVLMMGVEITGGWWFNSMAVLADGFTDWQTAQTLQGGEGAALLGQIARAVALGLKAQAHAH